MTFYSMMFGRNPQSAFLLAVIGFQEHDVPRFRDVHVEDEGRKIAVYTRMGGGNRGHWDGEETASDPVHELIKAMAKSMDRRPIPEPKKEQSK